MPLDLPSSIDKRYTLLRELGMGAYGVVWFVL